MLTPIVRTTSTDYAGAVSLNPASISHEPAAASNGRKAEDTVTISQQGRDYGDSESVFQVITAAGNRNINLSDYFGSRQVGQSLLDTSNLLLPNLQNVESLNQYISQSFPEFLRDHNIPEAPESMNFNSRGELVLPADYAHADALKTALSEDRPMINAIRTAHAISSHVAAIHATQPMRDEMAAAESEAEMAQLMMKYSHFLGEGRERAYPKVEVQFSVTGNSKIVTDDGDILA